MRLFKFIAALCAFFFAWYISFRLLTIQWMPETSDQWITTVGFSFILLPLGLLVGIVISYMLESLWDACK